MATIAIEPRPNRSRAATGDSTRAALQPLWLVAGTVSWIFAVGGRWDLPFAAWGFSVFLLRFSRMSRPAPAIVSTAVASVAVALFWAFELAVPLNAVTTMACVAYGLVFALPFCLDRLLTPRLGALAALFVYPATHTVCEFALGALSPQGASYGLLAVTQTADLPLLQMIAVTGPYGVGFLICLFATVANLCWDSPNFRGRSRAVAGGLAALLLAVVIGGGVRLAVFPPGGDYIRIAGISPSFGVIAEARRRIGHPVTSASNPLRVDPGIERAALGLITAELFDNTERAARAGARFVVWSENAAALSAADLPAFLKRAANLARKDRIYLVVADNIPGMRDETHMFGPDGALIWTYQKAHPIPGLEPYAPGDGKVPVVRAPAARVANVICYDADFPRMMRVAADIMLVPGGDWPEMGRVHTLKMASLRAIENGYSLFRQDFNGLSAAFDYQGRILAAQDTTLSDQHLMLADVPSRGVTTIYRVIGDVFAWLCVLATLVLISVAVVRSGRRGMRTEVA